MVAPLRAADALHEGRLIGRLHRAISKIALDAPQ
jgi:hypothetical protein